MVASARHSLESPGVPRTLIVDCESIVLGLLRIWLESDGFETIVASAAEEALRVATTRLDLLVTEVNLPGISGIELAERLSRMYADLRVLFIAGYIESAISERDGLGPRRAFLRKPFVGETLRRKVQQLMTR